MKKMVLVLCVALCMALPESNVVMAATTINNQGGASITRADIIEYIYEVRDGKLYKRLYNYSKEEWIGEWILCE